MLGLVQDGCVVPVGVMVFIPGMFCYGRLLDFPLFCCCLVFFKAGLQASLCLSNVYVRSQFLQGILYATPDLLMVGLLSLIHLGDLLAESVDGGEYRFDMVFPAIPPQVLSYIRYVDGVLGWLFLWLLLCGFVAAWMTWLG